METETYTMEYRCLNCGTTHTEQVPKGTGADMGHGKCPYCGESRRQEFTYKKPERY